jgi:hypothetical protein
MPKRRSQPKVRKLKNKPGGPSRYKLKIDGLLPSSVENPKPTPGQVKTKVPPLPAKRKIPKGAALVIAKVSGIYLRTGGYVFLTDKEKRRIYLSDGTLQRFDEDYLVLNGTTIECAVTEEERGLRAIEVYSITPP